MSLLAQIVLAGVIWVTGVGIGIKWQVGIQAVKVAESVRRATAQQDARRLDINRAAAAHEVFKTITETRWQQVEKEVERVVEKPVYSNVCLDDDGLRILADGIKARHLGSQPGPAVPAVADPDGEGWQKRAAVGQ